MPINSYQFLNTSIRTDSKLSIIERSREINEKMPDYVINLTLDGFKKCSKPIKDSSILILGISYKPDVRDVQLSPAKIIIDKLKALGAKIQIYDPYYKGSKIFGINVEQNIEDVLSKVDASIIITGHKEFQEIDPKIYTKMRTPILIDTRGIVDPSSAGLEKIIFRGLGRGNS